METMVKEAPVHFTDGALKQIGKLMSEPGFDSTQLLRVGVKGGGCSGLSYVLELGHKKEGDLEFELNDIPCVMNKAHEIYLFGMEIDWQDGLNNRGFIFKNPNASSTCGCGTSFAV
jgi:iron-sulfur cluster assembly protein